MHLAHALVEHIQRHTGRNHDRYQDEERDLPGASVLLAILVGLGLQPGHLAVQRGFNVEHLLLYCTLHLQLQGGQAGLQGTSHLLYTLSATTWKTYLVSATCVLGRIIEITDNTDIYSEQL